MVEKVREGSAGDIDLMDSVDRQTRGAAHGPDHELLLRHRRLLVSDTTTGVGYAYLGDRETAVVLLAATNRRTAPRLLWAALADAPAEEPVTIPHVTAANQWAIDVGHGGPAGAAPGRLPGAARDETARAVRSQRCAAREALPRDTA